MQTSPEWLIVGLGNPGKEYEKTRHNLGFLTLDMVAERLGLVFARRKPHSLFALGRLSGRQVVLAKPRTYMNLSGEAVRALSITYRTPPERILVVCDDFNLPLGRLRLRREGGDGGHKGLLSVTEHLKTKAFARLRLGVGPMPPDKDPAEFVLETFRRSDEREIRGVIERAADAVIRVVEVGLDRAMNEINRDDEPVPLQLPLKSQASS